MRKQAFKIFAVVLFFNIFFSLEIKANDLILEPVIQGSYSGETIKVVEKNKKFFINPTDFAKAIHCRPSLNGVIEIFCQDKEFIFDIKKMDKENYIDISGKKYISTNSYEKIMDIDLSVNKFEMLLDIDSDKDLPIIQKAKNQNKRSKFIEPDEKKGFKNYEFDNRLFSFPVIDFTFNKSYSVTDFDSQNKTKSQNNFYQTNLAMLFFNMDLEASIFGDNNFNDYSPRSRLTLSRIFLDEPKNDLNLQKFEAGDVVGIGSGYFNNLSAGKGLTFSSFKDFVLSADKTIDIDGTLSPGWEVELYQDGQLIGFRQTGINGQYVFENVPVNYGKNNFEVVLYGPYGEIQREDRTYYSGTSPVQDGEFGYNLSVYKPDSYLIDDNEPTTTTSNELEKTVVDFIGYYGIDDYMTLITGYNRSPDEITGEYYNFSTLGLQFLFSGMSFQYNTNLNLDTDKIGHHFDMQGDIDFGNFFTRYEYYGETKMPISFLSDEYLKDLFEFRLTGNLFNTNIPYYLSYTKDNFWDMTDTEEIIFRLSPSFNKYYNLTLENNYIKNSLQKQNNINLLIQANYGRSNIRGQLNYQTLPTSYLQSLNLNYDFRWDKNTYVQTGIIHNFLSNYTNQRDVDTLTLSLGKLFSFGGLVFSTSIDTEKNATLSLTYNIGVGKSPYDDSIFVHPEPDMTDQGTIYTKVQDDLGNPIHNAKIIVSGKQQPVATDENGEAIISDIMPYQKTQMLVDPDSLKNIALSVENNKKKLVLRPGTVKNVDITFIHKGAFEGSIKTPKSPSDYKILLEDKDGNILQDKYPYDDGTFLFDNVKYGEYQLVITDENLVKLKSENIKIDKSFTRFESPVIIK